MEIQRSLGADIIMTFDECTPSGAEHDYVLASVKLTEQWARQCLEEGKKNGQSLFGIVQGGVYPELREMSAKGLVSMGFDGYALGGLSVGEDKHTRERVIKTTMEFLPKEKPVYLMGVGTPEDIIESVKMGVDMFDCYLRHLFLSKEILSFRLNTIHNLYYYAHLMNEIRQAIRDDRLAEFSHGFYRGEIESL
jgi:queuine tRNA-ribosyltransferase